MEQWKKISGWHYKVSNFGRIRSIRNKIILKQSKNKWNYKIITLSKFGKKKTFYIHRLVLEYFGPTKPSPIHECNHKDGDKSFNWIGNLEWVTSSNNKIHAFKIGLRNSYGENNSQSKLTKKKVKWIRNLYKTGKYTQKELGKVFMVSTGHVGLIINNKRWNN
ncbi:MAG: NUMOD4 domain-containing protein [Desulfobacteraceae bacterium]|jgi:hypothetical protein